MESNTYYHGSNTLINDWLEPRPSQVVDMEKVVYATNIKWLSLAFIPRASDADIEIGFINFKPYILEQYPGAFELFNCSGYVYHVNRQCFQTDKRLGMFCHEFISHKFVPILYTEKINNVHDELKKHDVTMIGFKVKEEWLNDYLSKNH